MLGSMKMIGCLLLCLTTAFADETSELVDRLFDKDAEVRAAAREELVKLGDGALAKVLKRIEEREAGPSVLQVYDIRDFKTIKKWWPVVKGRIAHVGKKANVSFDDTRGTAVVLASNDLHAKIAAELDEMRKRMGTFVMIEARVLQLKKPVANMPQAMDKSKLDAWVKEHGITVINSPRLTTLNGEVASVSIANQRSYVKDFEVESSESGVIADPVIDIITSGLDVKMRAVVSHPKLVHVALVAKIAEIERDMPTLHLPLPIGPGVDVQFPVGSSHSVRRMLSCKPRSFQFVVVDAKTVIAVHAMAIEVKDIGEVLRPLGEPEWEDGAPVDRRGKTEKKDK